MTDVWRARAFPVASKWGPLVREGRTYRGLGLYADDPGSWCLVHLASGHALCWLKGCELQVIALAARVAEVGDWTFVGLDGWRNCDPGLMDRAVAGG